MRGGEGGVAVEMCIFCDIGGLTGDGEAGPVEVLSRVEGGVKGSKRFRPTLLRRIELGKSSIAAPTVDGRNLRLEDS